MYMEIDTLGKEIVVRVRPALDINYQSDMESFYRQRCIIHLPFREDMNSLWNRFEHSDENSWFLLYEENKLSNSEIDTTFTTIFESNEDNENDIEENNIHYNAFELISAHHNEKKTHELGQRLIDVAYDWNGDKSQYILEICQHKIMQISNNNNSTDNGHKDVKRIIIQGKAGSGKSTLIHRIVEEVSSKLGHEAIAVTAPTGAAALNINGSRLHSFFKISIFYTKFESLKDESLQHFQLKHKNLRFVIIDEMSLVGVRMLHQVERRCSDIFPEINEPFGGLCVLMFGDFRQLPPVKDAAIFMTKFNDFMSTNGRLVFDSFQVFVELSISHRQKDDTTFSQLLDHVASGNITSEEYNMLVQRKIVVIKAQNKPNSATNNEDCSGLADTLFLAIGCRVMLLDNTWVEEGLVNGSLGKVKAILYEDDVQPLHLPTYILVEFDSYNGPYLDKKLFPVTPIIRTWKKSGMRHTRKQFPWKLAYGITIHKSQGLTLPSAIVDIGIKEFLSGLTYVALNRVRSSNDVMFSCFYDKGRFDLISKSHSTKLKSEFLKTLSNKVRPGPVDLVHQVNENPLSTSYEGSPT
ncbi:uncharacterized protein LOC106652660 [Trichogramma pretiosum]|uniref:uncharacterized protein LOC106652660 n=1 Tax=Trichogramma pretiosum TaxID=7493 RepID=UPI0006C96CBE|nr:uncharacterized protein LOC106652660 [Trichogramma pretiosum]